MQIREILVPTDFSDSARHALDYACGLAERLGAGLHILHVPVVPAYILMDASYTPGPEVANQILAEASKALRTLEESLAVRGLAVRTTIREGVVHEMLREYAEEHDIDLLVMGTHGHTGVSKLMYGSVTERALKTVHTPTLVIPPGGAELPSRIVVAYDFSEAAKRAAQAACAMARVFACELCLVHAYLDVWGEYTDRGAIVGPAAEQRREALRLGLQEILETQAADFASSEEHPMQTRLAVGDPVQGVLEVAGELDANLVAAGTTGKSGIARLLMGSFTRRLLHDCKVPVLLAHAETP